MKFLILFLFTFLFATGSDVNQTILTKQLSQNEFFIKYQNYQRYKKILTEIDKIKRKARYSKKYREKLNNLKAELKLLGENKNLFDELIQIEPLPKRPEVTNPFAIFNAINYEKELKKTLETDENHFKEFLNTIQLLQSLKSKDYKNALNDFLAVKEIYKTKIDTLKKEAKIDIKKTNEEISGQIEKLIYLAISIAISILIFTLIKIGVKKYLKDENVYFANKILNFLNITVIALIITLFYINNATYVITILGFASAGIAIAMKDWFMNIFGWFVIMTSGNFKVGDRIKIELGNGNIQIVGDIVDITLNRIVLYEDVTLTTYKHNRRAGRMVFIPNNVIFTNPVFNYTHNGLSTVWDGIDITITFDSNHKKAVHLAKNIVNQYSKGYTDITKRRLNKLKSSYHIKNANVEPRVYTFIEDNGIRISCWYLNNYATLNSRSTISAEILEEFLKHDDIQIAYPTYSVKMEKNERLNQTQIPLSS